MTLDSVNSAVDGVDSGQDLSISPPFLVLSKETGLHIDVIKVPPGSLCGPVYPLRVVSMFSGMLAV